jgi:hypothetical protein
MPLSPDCTLFGGSLNNVLSIESIQRRVIVVVGEMESVVA